MSISLIKGRGWRYDFVLRGKRYTSTYYKTKSEARIAEVERKEEIKNPKPIIQTPTDMEFLELVNRRLDYVEAYNSAAYYKDYKYMAKKWMHLWSDIECEKLTTDMIQLYLLKRRKDSVYAANLDLRCLRALFNFGIKRGWIRRNPTNSIAFFPVEKQIKYIPSKEDVYRVILAADPDTQDYLWVIKETMGRMSEINQLTWADVNFEERFVVLYTRKKKGGHCTPRKIPMTTKLFEVLYHRYKYRDKSKTWVFWHRYCSSKTKEWKEGPYKDRKRIMKTLCKKGWS